MATIRRSGYVQQSKSLDDLIKGQLIYKDARDTEVNRAEEFLEKTDLLEGLKNSEIDSDLYRNYKNWRGELEGQIDSLLNDGRIDFATMGNIRRKYLTDFKPKEDLVKLRNTFIQQQASNNSPNIIYDKDYSKVSIDDMSINDKVRSLDLSAIEKYAYEDAVSKYMESGIPIDVSEDKNKILSSIDTSGYSEGDVNKVKNSINNGFEKADKAISEYNTQKESRDLQMSLQRRQLNKPDDTKVITETIKDPVTHREIKVYIKGEKVYTDKALTKEYKEGESTITDVDRDAYAALRGVYTYVPHEEKFMSGQSEPSGGNTLDSIEKYREFLANGSEKDREVLRSFIKEKGIDPYVMYAAGTVFIIYHDTEGDVYIKVDKKPTKPVKSPRGS